MFGNPYFAAFVLRRRNRVRQLGVLGVASRSVPVVAAALVLTWLLRPVILGFLDGPQSGWSSGVEGICLRLGLLLVSVNAIAMYTALIRGPERDVLVTLPVNPVAVVRYQVLRVALEKSWVLLLCVTLMSPVAWEASGLLYGLSILGLCSTWTMSLFAAACVHLLAVDLAESPRYRGLLDLIRGSNPREQAAFIYAPGVVLLGMGGMVALMSAGVRQVSSGAWLGLLWLGLPLVFAALLATRLPNLARSSWFKASAVLSDIDARYSSLMAMEDGLRVYMEWVCRALPSALSVYALKDLRYGWRARRPWLSGSWVLGLMGLIAGWTVASEGPSRALVVIIGSLALVGLVAVLAECDEPMFLKVWLPSGGLTRWAARFYVVFCWLQICIWPGVLAVLIRAGFGDAMFVLGMGEGIAVAITSLGLICSRWRARGIVAYSSLAAVASAGLSAWVYGA